jgi:hypothetical protein
VIWHENCVFHREARGIQEIRNRSLIIGSIATVGKEDGPHHTERRNQHSFFFSFSEEVWGHRQRMAFI